MYLEREQHLQGKPHNWTDVLYVYTYGFKDQTLPTLLAKNEPYHRQVRGSNGQIQPATLDAMVASKDELRNALAGTPFKVLLPAEPKMLSNPFVDSTFRNWKLEPKRRNFVRFCIPDESVHLGLRRSFS